MKKFKNIQVFFIVPALLFILVFFILPNIYNFYYSFTNWGPSTTDIKFIGFSNFLSISKNNRIFKDIWITLKYSFFVMFFMNTAGLGLALALEKNTRINQLFRILFFTPMLFSTLAAGYIFKAIYLPEGPINYFLNLIPGVNIHFAYLGSMEYTLIFVAAIQAWRWTGLNMLVYIAGLNTIPSALIEASKIEGASFWQTFKNVKFPLLGPAITFCIATSFIGSISAFDVIMAVTQGGPGGSTEVLNYFVFREFGASSNWGSAVAISLVLFFIICILGIPLISFLRKREIEL